MSSSLGVRRTEHPVGCSRVKATTAGPLLRLLWNQSEERMGWDQHPPGASSRVEGYGDSGCVGNRARHVAPTSSSGALTPLSGGISFDSTMASSVASAS